ncbi:MAG: hypothetical protein CVV44_06730 [Spirochaetae bacterium HGW-Spirochaetae-1]|jgi:pimeloyl-ACP methyl ester carboxylesterase|nr:MAG: hypothetical protein CVV44_06730 [Spirochaetae bacterium HGW-Spirochaetae-1]
MKKFFRSFVITVVVLLILVTGIYFLFPGMVLSAAVGMARWQAGVTEKTINVGDRTWHYLEGGSGPTVLLLHGFAMNKDFWGEMVPALTEHYRIIAPDLPGFGENSLIGNECCDLPVQSKRVHDFTESIKLKEYLLVGFSMGGGIAAWYASEYPGEVKGLVLIDPFGLNTEAVSDMEKLIAVGEKPFVFKNIAGYERLTALAYHNPPEIPGHFKRYVAALRAERYDTQEKIFDDLVTGGIDVLRNRLNKIRAGTLVVWGDRDRIFDVSTAHVFNRGIAGSRVLIIRDAGHMVYLEKPEETVPAIVAFLQGL